MVKSMEALIHISYLEQKFSVYSPISEGPLQHNASASSGADLDSHAASQSSNRQCEQGLDDDMPNSSESAYKATSLDSRKCQGKDVGYPPPQWTDFTANIPGYLSPYPCGKGFSARDNNRYLAFCGFRIAKDHLRSS